MMNQKDQLPKSFLFDIGQAFYLLPVVRNLFLDEVNDFYDAFLDQLDELILAQTLSIQKQRKSLFDLILPAPFL